MTTPATVIAELRDIIEHGLPGASQSWLAVKLTAAINTIEALTARSSSLTERARLTELDEALAAVGLEGHSVATLIKHHRANAGMAGAAEAMARGYVTDNDIALRAATGGLTPELVAKALRAARHKATGVDKPDRFTIDERKALLAATFEVTE